MKIGSIKKGIRDNYKGYLFIMPLILGLIFFTFYPMICSLIDSFFDTDLITARTNFGFQNYINLFNGSNESELFLKSLSNTVIYTVIEVPLSMILSYLLALSLQKETKTMYGWRVVFYLPVLIPGVVSGLLWQDILNTEYGIINNMLMDMFNVSFDFLTSEHIMGTFITTQLFTIGGGMIIWIAAFKSIPKNLYEAAKIDGANGMRCLLSITIPMSTPYIFYNLVMGLIGSFQMFSQAYVLTGGTGGDGDALLFYVIHIYDTAFSQLNFGLASSLSWVLFLIIGIFTLIVFKTSKWVYYGEEQ